MHALGRVYLLKGSRHCEFVSSVKQTLGGTSCLWLCLQAVLISCPQPPSSQVG